MTNEVYALQDILSWSIDKPNWQRDALRRLVLNGHLSDADITDLISIVKDPTLENVPLSGEHFTSKTQENSIISLKGLRNVQNVNALAGDQSIRFSSKGVTIIYGDNGSGKSGYVRILKSICRARTKGKPDPILGNIYLDDNPEQTAEIEYKNGDHNEKLEWGNTATKSDLLSSISVFDTSTANVHVEEKNTLSYTPFPMQVLENLTTACKKIKSHLDDEISILQGQTPKSLFNPNCSDNGKVAQLFKNLKGTTKLESVLNLAVLSSEESERLLELTTSFAQDPVVRARALRAQKARLDGFIQNFNKLLFASSDESIESLESLRKNLKNKTESANLASNEHLVSEPLDSINSEVWKSLWEAARQYSTEAYPDEQFPVTNDDAVCVLCHQTLTDDAKARLKRFEKFVTDKTQQDKIRASRELDEYISKTKDSDLDLKWLEGLKLLLSDELVKPDLTSETRRFFLHRKAKLRKALRSGVSENTKIIESSIPNLSKLSEALEADAQSLLATEKDPEKIKLRKEFEDLKDRKWLSTVKDDVLAEIERKKLIDQLNAALKTIKPSAVTAKNTELSKILVTDKLRSQFEREVDQMNLSGLAIELKQTGSKDGAARFQISLIDANTEKVGNILSEGEFRCIAVAGFLAELAVNNNDSGIIFDDPVSSLDHKHRDEIAKRLAVEGRKRQVIVFTHDLPFLFALKYACADVEDPALITDCQLRHIFKKSDRPGYCKNEAPEKAKSVEKQIQSLTAHLNNTKAQYDDDPEGTIWLVNARGIVDSLRQAWEAAVEKIVSPVLSTFSSKVDTKGFAKLSAITKEDAETMRTHYGRCSIILHNSSKAANPQAPTPEEIFSEIDALNNWISAIEPRQKQILVH